MKAGLCVGEKWNGIECAIKDADRMLAHASTGDCVEIETEATYPKPFQDGMRRERSRQERRITERRKALRRIQDIPRMEITDRRQARDERRKFQFRLLQTMKMEAVRELTAGIAHNFNNILQGINGFAQLLLLNNTEKDPEYIYGMQILKFGERAAEHVRELILFSHKMEAECCSINMNQVVRGIIAVLQRDLSRKINIELIRESCLWPIAADPALMERILLNLGGNAADAMPKGGNLVFTTENITLGNDCAGVHLDAKPGRYVLVTVSDTGCGMETETIKHIFDPFFTTKGLGKGLGLSAVYGIVNSIGGHIICESEVGRGTTFKIYLPAVEEPDFRPAKDFETAG